MLETKSIQERALIPKLSVLVFSFAINFDNVILIPILAHIVIEMGGDYFLAGIVVGIYSIVHLFSNLFSGYIIDKFGRKNVITLGLFLDTIAMMFYYASRTIPFLILTRIIHGLGGGLAGPATMTYLSDISKREKVSQSMSMYGIFFGLSYLIGFAVSGIISYYYGYSALFLLTAALLVTLGIASTTLPKVYKSRPKTSAEIPIPIKEIVLQKPILSSYLTTLSIYFNLGVITAVFTDILYQLGMDHREVAAVLSTFIIVSILIQYPSGKLVDKGYGKHLLIMSLIVTSLAFLISAISLTKITAYLTSAVFGLAHGLSFPTASGLISKNTESYYRGKAKGILFAIMVIGVALGSNLGGYIASTLSPTTLWWVSSIQAVILCLLVIKTMESRT